MDLVLVVIGGALAAGVGGLGVLAAATYPHVARFRRASAALRAALHRGTAALPALYRRS